MVEGNSGTTNLVFALTLSKPASETVMVDYATRDASAVAGSDYSVAFGVAIFPPGITREEILVSVNGDVLSEADETFWLMLTNAVNANLIRDHAIGTILDDDSPPGLSINDVSMVEDYRETTNAIFNVNLSAASGQTITVDYMTADGSAIAGRQFVPVSDMLTFVPGITRQTLTVPVTSGSMNSAAASFSVNLLNPVNATIVRNRATATIMNEGPLRTLLANRPGNQPFSRTEESTTSAPKPSLGLAPLVSPLPTAKLNPSAVVRSAMGSERGTNTTGLKSSLKTMSLSVSNNSLEAIPRQVADLCFSLLASTNFVHVEQSLTFVVTVTNKGPESASAVFVTNRLPASATFLSAQSSQGTYAQANDLIIFNIGTLSNSSRASATITLKFSAAGSATNTAQLTATAVNTVGTNKSASVVVLAINDLPKISRIPGQVTYENVPTTPIPLVVTDNETHANDLILFGTSSNTDLVPDENFIFGGISSKRTLILVPAPNRTGATEVSVTVLDSEGGEASTDFTLSVLPTFRTTLRIESIERVPASPKIEHIERAGDWLKLDFNAEPGRTYAVECCDSMSFDATWQTLTNIGVSETSTLVEFSDAIGDRPQRFYRLSVSGAAQTSAPAAQIDLSFDAMPGQAYTIEYCDSLVTGSWHGLTNIGPVSTQSTITISDSTASQPQRFYRLRSP